MSKPIALVILDGWGLSDKSQGNPLSFAKLPTIKKLNDFYPHTALQASGISVGLPWGEAGNSEVGHITIGTGQTIYQNLPRITMSIQNGEFFKNNAFLQAIAHAKKNNSAVHLMGLVGKGGIHSTIDHLYGLLELLHDQKFENVFIHAFTDGRDSAPTSGAQSIRELQERLAKESLGQIATIGGRYYAMDRNNNWDRVKLAYDAMVSGIGEQIEDPIKYLDQSYKKEVLDEYILPAVVVKNGQPIGRVKDNDAIIFFNFREDRARQITKAFVLPGFNKFEKKPLENLFFVTMVQYESDLPVEIAFPVIEVSTCLGKILSKNKLTQLRIAETEKFAHVTYFFNGGEEEAFPGEDRVIIPSKDVPRFDGAPEMSAHELTEKVIDFVQREKYDFILLNYANADIVGHTGNEKAATIAVETIDKCLAELISAVLLKDGCLLITADHGNVEEMVNLKTGENDTEHSTNPVPLWFVTSENHREKPRDSSDFKVGGLLSDIAPTILDLFKIEKPKEITGESLLPLLISSKQ
ncbi:MAG: 2,3-bisphosphoglycerate-independent phosphoglycerate mutase [Candidatus Moraniibacteriota bacterium]